MSKSHNNISTKKEYKINENTEINEELFFPKNINEGSQTPFGNNYNNIICQDLATNCREKNKPIFNIEHAQTLNPNYYKMNKDDITYINAPENSKTVNDVEMNIPKPNVMEEDVTDLNIINNIDKNHSFQKINKSNLNEITIFTEMKKIEENIIDLQIKSNSTDSLSDSNIILCKLSNQILELQNLDKQFKEICETQYINLKENELNDSQKKSIVLGYILKKFCNRKYFNVFQIQIPKYLKNKDTNKAKFLENGVKRLIDECAQSLHNLIMNLSKKYVNMYKLNIKAQLKFGMKDFKLFFEKSVRNIYYDILPKKKPFIYKSDKQKGRNCICDKIKKRISTAIEKENKDENVKEKILNIIFSETTCFWTFLEAFINDSKEITFINKEYKEEKIKLEGFKTLKDYLFLFKKEEKNEIRERVIMIKEGKVKTRKKRKKK